MYCKFLLTSNRVVRGDAISMTANLAVYLHSPHLFLSAHLPPVPPLHSLHLLTPPPHPRLYSTPSTIPTRRISVLTVCDIKDVPLLLAHRWNTRDSALCQVVYALENTLSTLLISFHKLHGHCIERIFLKCISVGEE